MQLTLRPLDPANEADVRAAYQISAAALAHDVPDFHPLLEIDFRGRFAYPWPGSDDSWWLAELDGAPVGWLTVSLPTLDNLHLAEAETIVHPDHRRRGVGRALYEQAIAFARDSQRRTLTATYGCALPGGAPRDDAFRAFAEAMGAKAALPEIRRRLDLDSVDTATWDALLAEAWSHAEGYSVVRWVGGAPEEYIDDLAYLDGRLITDAPMGDLDIEPMKVDADRIRAADATIRNRGRRAYHVGLRHDASGRLVAWTEIAFDAGVTTHAWQQITIVDPDHRGHRLGLVAKIENLRHTLAHEPGVRHINTWNAAENSYMIAINETLGFRAIDGWVECQQEV
jgi:GNAT superfamily N-acetyltransferase